MSYKVILYKNEPGHEKTTSSLYEHQRRRSASTSTQFDQRHCSQSLKQAWFVSDLVENNKDRFSGAEAQMYIRYNIQNM